MGMQFLKAIPYFGLGVILLALVFVLTYTAVNKIWRSRRFRLGQWMVWALLASAMLHSMATKPDGDAMAGAPADHALCCRPPAPADDSPQQQLAATNFVISGFAKTPSNILIEASRTSGFFSEGTTVDCFAAFLALTNDWQWLKSVPAPSCETNVVVEIVPEDLLGSTNFPAALFLKVVENAPAAVDPDDIDEDGVDDGCEPFVPPVVYEDGTFVEGELLTNLSAAASFTSTGRTDCVDFVFPEPIEMGGSSYVRMSLDRNGVIYLRPAGSVDVIASCDFPDDLAGVLSRVNDCVLMPYWSRLVCSSADPDCQVRIERTNEAYVVTYQNMRFDPSGVMDQVPVMLRSLVPMLVNQTPVSFQVVIDPVSSSVSYNYRLGEDRGGLLGGLTTGKLAAVGYQGRFASTCYMHCFGEEVLSSETRIQSVITSGTDPSLPDTDGDGMNDGDELRNGRNPVDPTDAEESDEASVVFVFGDPSWTHSESYRVVVAPVTGEVPTVQPPETVELTSAEGAVSYEVVRLKKGWKYTVRMYHEESALDDPDYDYVLAFASMHPKVTILDPQGMRSCHVYQYLTEAFSAGGKEATILVRPDVSLLSDGLGVGVIIREGAYTNKPGVVVAPTSSVLKVDSRVVGGGAGRMALQVVSGANKIEVYDNQACSGASLTFPVEWNAATAEARSFYVKSVQRSDREQDVELALQYSNGDLSEQVGFNLTAIELTVEAQANFPTNKIRHVFGPFEEVLINQEPAAPQLAMRQLLRNQGEIYEGGRMICPGLPCKYRIRLFCYDERVQYSPRFEVIAPTTMVGRDHHLITEEEYNLYRNLPGGESWGDIPSESDMEIGAIMVFSCWMEPSYVSFANIKCYEGVAPATSLTGSFCNTNEFSAGCLDHSAAAGAVTNYLRDATAVTGANYAGDDRAAFWCFDDQITENSSYQVDIPIWWYGYVPQRVEDEIAERITEPQFLMIATQKCTVVDRACCIEKMGGAVSRTYVPNP